MLLVSGYRELSSNLIKKFTFNEILRFCDHCNTNLHLQEHVNVPNLFSFMADFAKTVVLICVFYHALVMTL